MRDCPNAAMRDVLPDLLHERGPAVAREQAWAHVASCDACRAELELLRRVRAAASAPRVDVARISAGIPPYVAPGRSYRWLQVAAAVLIVAGGAALLVQTRTSQPAPDVAAATPADSLAIFPVAPRTPEPAPVTVAQAPVTPAPAAGAAIASPIEGYLADLSDEELRGLLDDIAGIDAMTSLETDVVVLPAFERRGGE